MRSSALVLVLMCCLASSLLAQGSCLSVVNAPSADPMAGGCNVIPFGQNVAQSAGYTYMSRIPAGLMDIGNPYVEDLSFASCRTGVWASSTVIIAMGHLPPPVPAPSNFPTVDGAGVVQGIGDFLDLTIIHNSFATGTPGPVSTTGPFSWNLSAFAWSPMGFAASLGTGFQWDGINDVGFFVTFQNATVTGSSIFTGSMRAENLLRSYSAGYNRATSSTANSALALNMRLNLTQGPSLLSIPTWQCNNASAGLTVNGVSGPGPAAPIRTAVGTGTILRIDFSGLSGTAWDLAFTIPEPGLPVGAGGLLTPGAQAVNINLAVPSFQFLFNGTLANAFAPFSNFVSSASPQSLSAQTVFVDPGSADGFSLSALNEVTWGGCNANQDFEVLNLGTFTGASVPISWSSPSNGGGPWSVGSFGTLSAGTGPTNAFRGINYLYCETSMIVTGSFSFDTCPTDVSQLSLLNLGFALSRIGATVGTLNVYMDDGTSTFSTLLATYSGADPGQSQNGVEWSSESISFVPTGSLVAFRFEYFPGASVTGDLAIDDLLVQ